MPKAMVDSTLCLFPEKVTPNHHRLAARICVARQRFMLRAQVSADGHEWTMGAYATILWRNSGH